MTTLVYLLGYLGVLGFAVTSLMKIMKYVKSTPLHVRWELYPVPHEGERAKHGGSYLEEFEWWKNLDGSSKDSPEQSVDNAQ